LLDAHDIERAPERRAHIVGGKTHSRPARRERVKQIRPARAHHSSQPRGISGATTDRNGVKAAHVEREIECPRNLEPSRVPNEERAHDARVLRPPARLRDRAPYEVHAYGLPAVPREIHDVRSRSAAEVERATRRMRRDKALELRRSYARIPRRLPWQPVPEPEKEPPHVARLGSATPQTEPIALSAPNLS